MLISKFSCRKYQVFQGLCAYSGVETWNMKWDALYESKYREYQVFQGLSAYSGVETWNMIWDALYESKRD